jgi:hypothetical protein
MIVTLDIIDADILRFDPRIEQQLTYVPLIERR